MLNGIDELLNTVSGGDFDCPRFAARYEGDMTDDRFLVEVNDYLLEVIKQRDQYRDMLKQLVEASWPTYAQYKAIKLLKETDG